MDGITTSSWLDGPWAISLSCCGAHDVQTTFDDPSTLQAAQAYRPDVILLDMGMPGMSGHDVASQLRQMPQFQKGLPCNTCGPKPGLERSPNFALEGNSRVRLTVRRPVCG